jgi:hypothetical protein
VITCSYAVLQLFKLAFLSLNHILTLVYHICLRKIFG